MCRPVFYFRFRLAQVAGSQFAPGGSLAAGKLFKPQACYRSGTADGGFRRHKACFHTQFPADEILVNRDSVTDEKDFFPVSFHFFQDCRQSSRFILGEPLQGTSAAAEKGGINLPAPGIQHGADQAVKPRVLGCQPFQCGNAAQRDCQSLPQRLGLYYADAHPLK